MNSHSRYDPFPTFFLRNWRLFLLVKRLIFVLRTFAQLIWHPIEVVRRSHVKNVLPMGQHVLSYARMLSSSNKLQTIPLYLILWTDVSERNLTYLDSLCPHLGDFIRSEVVWHMCGIGCACLQHSRTVITILMHI